MKQSDIQKCCCCDRGVMHDGAITFFVVTLQRFMADIGAISRQHHLEGMLQPLSYLAMFMGPDEDLAKPVTDPIKVFVCDQCAMNHPLFVILELAGRNKLEEKGISP